MPGPRTCLWTAQLEDLVFHIDASRKSIGGSLPDAKDGAGKAADVR